MNTVFLNANVGQQVLAHLASVWGSADAPNYLNRVAAHFRQASEKAVEVGEGDRMVLSDLMTRFDYSHQIQADSLEMAAIECIMQCYQTGDEMYNKCMNFLSRYFDFAYKAKRLCGPCDEKLVGYVSKLKTEYREAFCNSYLFVITAFAPQIKKMAWTYSPNSSSFEDFLQQGRECILRVLPGFDPSKSGLSTYIRIYLSHEFMDALPDGLSTHYQAWLHSMTRKASDALEAQGVMITSKSIADYINAELKPYKDVSPGQIEKVLAAVYTSASLDAMGGDAPSDTDDPLTQIIREEDAAEVKIAKFRKTLDPVLRDILDLEIEAYSHSKTKPKTCDIKQVIHRRYPGCSEDRVAGLMRTLERLLVEFIRREDGKTINRDSYVMRINIDHQQAAKAEMDDLTSYFMEKADDDIGCPDF